MYYCLWLTYTRRDWLQWIEDRETPQMCKYGESKMNQIMMATVPHTTAWLVHTKYQADGFLFNWVYIPVIAYWYSMFTKAGKGP